jgi:hypothetical protein
MTRRELPDALGNNVHQKLLAGDHFGRVFEKLAGHKARKHGAGKKDRSFGGTPPFVKRTDEKSQIAFSFSELAPRV